MAGLTASLIILSWPATPIAGEPLARTGIGMRASALGDAALARRGAGPYMDLCGCENGFLRGRETPAFAVDKDRSPSL
jgi:hypothetical protein